MDVIHSSSKVTKQEFVTINKVRQHFKVILLSDIADLQGSTIIPNETLMDSTKQSTLTFRPQAPTAKMIITWMKIAVPILRRYLQKHPLGSWTRKPHTKTWNAYISRDHNYIMDRKTSMSYEICNPTSHQFREIRPRSWKTKQMYPADIRHLKNTIQLQTSWNRTMVTSEPQRRNINEQHGRRATICGNMYGDKFWGKVQIGRYQHMRNIYNLICEGELVAATDGSCRNSIEAHAWCLAEKNDANMVVKGCGPVHNSHEDANSTRPEMYVIIAVLSFAGHVIQYFNAMKTPKDIPTIVMYTDSEISINNTKKSHYPTTRNAFENNIDVKIQLSLLLKKLPFRVKFEHVYAHQQGKIEWNKMHIKTQLNTLMDGHTATYFRSVQSYLPHQQHCEHLPAQVMSFSLPFDRPTPNTLSRLQDFRIDMRQKWQWPNHSESNTITCT